MKQETKDLLQIAYLALSKAYNSEAGKFAVNASSKTATAIGQVLEKVGELYRTA